jgi:RNA recognition motif-containing protein
MVIRLPLLNYWPPAGNLSSERVSKREVFDLFHRYGRLAQISLKSAYGFVQYHSAEDAARAMAGAQGLELGGRKISES